MGEPSANPTFRLTPRGVTIGGMVINAALSLSKILGGMLFSSHAILADGLHSASDLLSDLAVLAGLRVSGRPADRDHHYGHRRVSTLVALIVGAMLLLAAAYIMFEAIQSLRSPAPHDVRPMIPLVLALASIVLKEALYHVTLRVGRRAEDLSLAANAWHHRSDAFSSVAAAAGLGGVMIGGADWAFLDAVTAAVLSTFLLVVAAKIISSSASELIDHAPDARTLSAIAQAVARTDGVQSYHAFRARKVGGKIAMDVHVLVRPDVTVEASHEIATRVERDVMLANPRVAEVVVHVEPGEAKDPTADVP